MMFTSNSDASMLASKASFCNSTNFSQSSLEWQDDRLMFDLMQEIKRPQHLDPDGYNRKVKFWKRQILDYIQKSRICIFDVASLKSVFHHNLVYDGQAYSLEPKCLDVVLGRMVEDGEIRPISLPSDGSFYGTTFRVMKFVVKTPASIFSYMRSYRNENDSLVVSKYHAYQPFLHPELLDKLAYEFFGDFLLEFVKNNRLSVHFAVIEETMFNNQLNKWFQHQETRNAVLEHLEKVKHVIRKEVLIFEKDKTSIKVIVVSDRFDLSLAPMPEQDRLIVGAMVRTKTLISNLERHADKLRKQIIEKNIQCRDWMRTNDKISAKGALKRRKILDKSLQQNQDQLISLEHSLQKVESSNDNAKILQAFETAIKATKKEDSILAIEKTQEVMEDLLNLGRDQREIGEIITTSQDVIIDESDDDAELEREMKLLIEEDRMSKLSIVGDPLSDSEEDTQRQKQVYQAKPLISS